MGLGEVESVVAVILDLSSLKVMDCGIVGALTYSSLDDLQ